MSYHSDPTHDEMLEYLKTQNAGLRTDESFAADAEVAIYWFAVDWHGGASTNLYSAICTSPFNPGPVATFENECDTVKDLYADLEAEYAAHTTNA